jgi:uncharacterized repeat protein (TIGR03803 family)
MLSLKTLPRTLSAISIVLLAACSGGRTVTPQLPGTGVQLSSTGVMAENANPCPTILVISPPLAIRDLGQRVDLTDALEVRHPWLYGFCKVVSETHPPAEWSKTGGSLHVMNGGRRAIFFDPKSGFYSVSARAGTYRAESTVVVQPDNEWVLATDAQSPNGSLLLGGDGALYGVSYSGGAPNCQCGYVFKLARGTSTTQTIYSFHSMSTGFFPAGALIADKKGNLFGTTIEGGIIGPRGSFCCGTVYELERSGAEYKEHVIYRFRNAKTGTAPYAGVVADRDGALYGTTSDGVVFKLTPSGSSYAYSRLYRFRTKTGNASLAGLALSSKGVVYGTMPGVGPCSCGIAFELVPDGTAYSEKTIYTFNGGADGYDPNEIIASNTGKLFGTTASGGLRNPPGNGTVFELTPSGARFTKRTLYRFSGGADGADPVGVTLGLHGVIYGAAFGGGVGRGTIFALTPRGTTYGERTVHVFGETGDGALPIAPLISDAMGALYGVTYYQAPSVFKVKP